MVEQVLLPIWPDAGRALGGLGRTSIYKLIQSGELKTVTIGRRRFVPVSAIKEYAARLDAEQSGSVA